MHTRVPEIKSLMSLKTVPKLDTHSATVLHLLRQPVHRRGSDSNHGLGLDTLFIDTHEQNFIRRLLPLELELLLSCTTTKTPNTWKRCPIPSHSKWCLKNIYPNTLKWVINAYNWNFFPSCDFQIHTPSIFPAPQKIWVCSDYLSKIRKTTSPLHPWARSRANMIINCLWLRP